MSYSAGPGGAERILADHASALGADTCVACPDGWLAGALRGRGVRTFPLRERPLALRGGARAPAAAALHLAGHAREVRELVANLRPRLVVAWGMRSLLACAAARLDTPLVFQHNDLLPGTAIAAAVQAAAHRCEAVLALSHAIADDLGDARTQVIHPGVDLRSFVPSPPVVERTTALFLAALAPWKRPELAIEAAREAGVELVIAGGPVDAAGDGYAADLRARAGEDVTFAGRVEDPRPALRVASCLLHCADREPFGMALVEALACGVPVVAPDAGGPAEIVDASCGRLYPPGDAQGAARALGEALADRERLGAGARARAERHFDLGASRAAFARAVDSVAPPEQPAPGDGIAVVTVLHDSAQDMRRLMTSLDRHLPGAHLIAVDSGSSDDSVGADAVRDWSGNSTVIELGENVGYGRATNAGIDHASEPVTVIANPDVELLDSSLALLAAEAGRGDRILAPLVIQPDGRLEPSAHPEPPELAAAFLPGHRRPSARRIAWAAGCCLVARTDLLRRLGPFDERIFLYAEDMDLGLRAADAGVETRLDPRARVLHRRAHSTQRAFGGEPFDLLARRRAEVVEQLRGKHRARTDAAVQALTFASRIALKAALGRPTGRERAQLAAVIRAARGS
ncbi:MAG: N-acetylglucosaminyl-diphospho-decaprenol L-rhamnosyltransferase [Thermoleophilaceae bacterium]|nr:N-acetylglucosaminyl-diphospho-decaprenol L-rhamnosyltransferase [Thermoleophilaceae bacterium]